MSKQLSSQGLTQKISIRNARFFAFHGFYEEERIIGNEYFVNLSVGFTPKDEAIGALRGENSTEDLLDQNTINYELLYQVIKEKMHTPQKLLEKVALEILDELCHRFQQLERVEIEIEKVNPPFGGDHAKASVCFSWSTQSKNV